MVQQMMDPTAKDLGLSNTETSLPKSDKQQFSLKKTALRDLQNDNILRPRPVGNSHFLKDRGPTMAPIKVSGIKRHALECPTSASGHQSPSNNNANGHLVYVRRKSESEVGKSSTCEIMENSADCPPLRQFNHGEQGTSRKQTQMDSKISCFPAFAPIPMAPMTFSSGGPTVPFSLGKSDNEISPAEPNYPAVSVAVPLASPLASNQHWRERSSRLQTFLRNCDHSSQEEYIQMLRSLSAAGRSKQAVGLEKKAIQLLLEEGRELHRMKVLNVLGKSAQKSSISPCT
ncbi:hypothetical protein NE237_016920 [Protea cynaroides]|uniref:Uncharacterized protein n=1 Tax=Protea cynaroides TaxID=273540 RepID=A0A9Q0K6K5_9MAGN|nr:hypothetical protein NE237_016920 [Protea cynaroides]